ncbi:glycosyltransferase family 2 protein [Paenibacillus chitinolyticus]|uniref:Glycosyltransferase family 2 protein n=1 Tax=Paenibacillus chitinolyticus TaxID=79263 RepID=A0A410WRP8_9BACL|nr:glycosyltransferase family 2 protein [Paenibacillus chitinolyticus]MCY9592016.1 glycosyltransferase family 2 protein [Paenibacillus chitinolyticus]MCY9598887.1 glycosyltransferase family 2 protein [Paenibacillus chitinolyticus]QAV17088.1 glycosyltransferase family 2 protein [Paenibacillus chitinolyticus]
MRANDYIAVLLSTYNGQDYIKEFLNSLYNQTVDDFMLYIRDDGSKDDTRKIIDEFKKDKKNIIFLEDNNNLGPVLSFNSLLEVALENKNIKYFMFADQDDIWLIDKIETSLSTIKKEEENSGQLPLLVHTDLTVVDQKLEVIGLSFFEYQKLNPKRIMFNHLLMQNVITGCTVIINRELAKVCFPISSSAIMHDWWIGLTASVFGKVVYLNRTTILYRQHSGNSIGAKKYDIRYLFERLTHKVTLIKNIYQARSFHNNYADYMDESKRYILEQFLSLKDSTFLIIRFKLIKNKFLKHGILRNVGLLLRLKN